MPDPEPPAGGPPRREPRNEETYAPRAVLLGLLFCLLLVFGGLFLVKRLRDTSNLQDCVMQGRSNCAPVDSSTDR
jgi:flagellar biogenesis protein FliO